MKGMANGPRRRELANSRRRFGQFAPHEGVGHTCLPLSGDHFGAAQPIIVIPLYAVAIRPA
jgi:hypothetical protein